MKAGNLLGRASAIVGLIMIAGFSCRASGSADAGSDAGVSAGGDAVGVAECDDYLAAYEKCLANVPSERRQAMADNIKRNRAAWRALAADPGARPGLAQACGLARDSARSATQAYGCSW